MSCTKIAAGITLNCDSLTTNPGVESEQIHLMNWTDIDRGACTFDSTNPLKLKSVSMVAAATGFTFEGAGNSVRPTYSNVQEGFLPNKLTHNLNFRVFNYTDANKKILNDMIGTKIVAFVFTKSEVVDVLGWNQGMMCTLSKDFFENDGSFDITLATPEGSFERSIPYSFVGAVSPEQDFEANKTEVLAL